MQYVLMAAFCWMLVEGIYIYVFVVKVFNIVDKIRVYHVVSWGKEERQCDLCTYEVISSTSENGQLLTLLTILGTVIIINTEGCAICRHQRGH